MKRIDENTIALTNGELDDITSFIYSTLNADWDRYTDTFICSEKWHEGVRKMNPRMYDLQEQMALI